MNDQDNTFTNRKEASIVRLSKEQEILLRFDVQLLDPQGNAVSQFQIPNYEFGNAMKLIQKQLTAGEIYAFLIKKATKMYEPAIN